MVGEGRIGLVWDVDGGSGGGMDVGEGGDGQDRDGDILNWWAGYCITHHLRDGYQCSS